MPTLDLVANEDAYEDSTGANYSDTDTLIRCASNTATTTPNRQYFGAFHFVLTAEIPDGATIDVCYPTIQAVATNADDPNVDIAFEDSADAPDFTTNADVTSRTRAGSSTQWTTTGIGTSPVNGPSLVTQLQALLDAKNGLANGAGLVLFFDGRSDVNQSFGVVSLEGTGDPAALHIEFTAAGGTTHDATAALNGQAQINPNSSLVLAAMATLPPAAVLAPTAVALRQAASQIAGAAILNAAAGRLLASLVQLSAETAVTSVTTIIHGAAAALPAFGEVQPGATALRQTAVLLANDGRLLANAALDNVIDIAVALVAAAQVQPAVQLIAQPAAYLVGQGETAVSLQRLLSPAVQLHQTTETAAFASAVRQTAVQLQATAVLASQAGLIIHASLQLRGEGLVLVLATVGGGLVAIVPLTLRSRPNSLTLLDRANALSLRPGGGPGLTLEEL